MANEDSNKSPYMIKLVLLAVAVVVAIILLWQMVEDEPPEEAPHTVQEETIPDPDPTPVEPQEPEPAEQQPAQAPEPEPEPLPDLADSDAVVLAAADELGPQEDVSELLVEDNVLLKSVRAVIALADGNVVHEYRPVDSPDTPFVAERLDQAPDPEVGQRYRLSPENYQRYDRYVSVLTSLEPGPVADVYERFYPLLEEAYAQHGVERGSFKEVTLEAIDSVLAAPELDEPPVLIQPKVHFQFEDQQLESLPGVQKLLIRMGPENTRKVKDVLRDIREAIADTEVPEEA